MIGCHFYLPIIFLSAGNPYSGGPADRSPSCYLHRKRTQVKDTKLQRSDYIYIYIYNISRVVAIESNQSQQSSIELFIFQQYLSYHVIPHGKNIISHSNADDVHTAGLIGSRIHKLGTSCLPHIVHNDDCDHRIESGQGLWKLVLFLQRPRLWPQDL